MQWHRNHRRCLSQIRASCNRPQKPDATPSYMTFIFGASRVHFVFASIELHSIASACGQLHASYSLTALFIVLLYVHCIRFLATSLVESRWSLNIRSRSRRPRSLVALSGRDGPESVTRMQEACYGAACSLIPSDAVKLHAAVTFHTFRWDQSPNQGPWSKDP